MTHNRISDALNVLAAPPELRRELEDELLEILKQFVRDSYSWKKTRRSNDADARQLRRARKKLHEFEELMGRDDTRAALNSGIGRLELDGEHPEAFKLALLRGLEGVRAAAEALDALIDRPVHDYRRDIPLERLIEKLAAMFSRFGEIHCPSYDPEADHENNEPSTRETEFLRFVRSAISWHLKPANMPSDEALRHRMRELTDKSRKEITPNSARRRLCGKEQLGATNPVTEREHSEVTKHEQAADCPGRDD